MTTILDLPENVINVILCSKNISIQDCVNLCSTCKHFRQMIENMNVLWQRKFYERYSCLKEICEKEKYKRHINFGELIKIRRKCKKELQHFLAPMRKNPNYYDTFIKYELSFEKISRNVEKRKKILIRNLNLLFHPCQMTQTWNYYCFVDELRTLLESSQSGCEDNFIKQENIFYAFKLLLYLKQCDLKIIWQEFMKRPAELQLLEEGAILIAQWFQPKENIFYLHIKTELNNIAQEVIKHLKSKHPMHPIFSTSNEQLLFWQDNNIYENQWNDSDGKQILDILCKLLSELNFHTYSENTNFLQKYFLDCMVNSRVGYLISLGIIFQSVARRLGIRCDLIFSTSHCFLYWKPKYNITNSDNEQYVYINVLYNDTFLYTNDYIETDEAMKLIKSAQYETTYETENAYEHGRINSVKLILKLFHSIIPYIFKIHTSDVEATGLTQVRTLELQHLIKSDNLSVIMRLNTFYEYYYDENAQKLLIPTLITALKKVDYKKYGKLQGARAKVLLNKLLKKYKNPDGTE